MDTSLAAGMPGIWQSCLLVGTLAAGSILVAYSMVRRHPPRKRSGQVAFGIAREARLHVMESRAQTVDDW